MSPKSNVPNEIFIIKEFIQQVLSYKYFYIVSIIALFVLAFAVNRYSPKIYSVDSTIGPIEDNRSSILESNELFTGMRGMSKSRNMENDIKSLNSFTLVSETIKRMGLEIGYFINDTRMVRQSFQVYKDSPFSVSLDRSHVQSINAGFKIDILDGNSYRLTISEDNASLYNYLDNVVTSTGKILEIDTICRFNETVTSPFYRFSITLNREHYIGKSNDISYYFELYHLDHITKQYLDRLSIAPLSVRSTLIHILFQGENVELAVDFLNGYLQTYLDNSLSKKNKIALNTINFIDSQISEISDSMLMSETKLRNYRSSNQVTDLSYQGQQALTQMTQIENERSSLQIQERYYNYVLDYFNKNKDMAGLAPPSSANVVDPFMNSLVLELINLNAQRASILSNNAEKNLFLGQIENKIKLQKQTIIENVKNNLNTLNITQNELNYRAEKLSKEIARLPKTELNMVSMEREFKLTDAIYTFLLQKRSESAISMASNSADYEILEPARLTSVVLISPKPKINYLLALLFSLLIPTLFIIIKNFFNEKITSVRDVENLIQRPVLNLIYTNLHKTETIVSEFRNSSMAESFRNLRSNLFLKSKSGTLKVIMVTSPQPMDGKSFVALNLACSIAAVGRKVVIIDCDLRRPSLHEKFRKEYPVGLSNYMDKSLPKEEIIFNTGISDLSFVPAGPVLANSSELIESGVLDDLMAYLKTTYDYVIIDTTPAGIVSDAIPMARYADHILLVCRNNSTRKDIFADVLNLFQENKIANFDIVFNDLNHKKSRYSKYTDYYGKG